MKSLVLGLLVALATLSAWAHAPSEHPVERVLGGGMQTLAVDFGTTTDDTFRPCKRPSDPMVREPFWASLPVKQQLAAHRGAAFVRPGSQWLGLHVEPAANPASPRDPPPPVL